jgi:hypothetical protein
MLMRVLCINRFLAAKATRKVQITKPLPDFMFAVYHSRLASCVWCLILCNAIKNARELEIAHGPVLFACSLMTDESQKIAIIITLNLKRVFNLKV